MEPQPTARVLRAHIADPAARRDYIARPGQVQLERPARMMSIGAFVLLAGAALVGGALYHKTHSDEIETWLARVRARFGAWE